MLKFLKLISIGLIGSTSFCLGMDIIKDNKENIPLNIIKMKPIEKFEEKEDLSALVNQKTIRVGQKDYQLSIDDSIQKAVLLGNISKEQLEEAFTKIENKKPSKKVVGYSIGLCGKRVSVECFLGDNAK